jgi:hypothetical protein
MPPAPGAAWPEVDCLAILAPPSALAALHEGVAAKHPRPALIALAEAGEVAEKQTADTRADYWHPLPINPRQLARILKN